MEKENRSSGKGDDPVVITETPMRGPPDLPEGLGEEIEVVGSTESQVLLLLEDPPSAKMIKVFEDLMLFFGANSWSDLEVFGCDDVLDWFKTNHTDVKRVIQKRLGYIVEYARHSVLRDSTTMRDIMAKVTGNDAAKQETVLVPAKSNDDSLKKLVPNIEKFSGIDEDYYTWRDKVINDLGKHGLGKYVLNDDYHILSPDVSESVFYALRGALADGLARNHAQSMYDEGNFNPRDLWLDLSAYYDTPVNRANINVYEIRRLFSLVLDESTTPTKFIADMRNCLQRLKAHKATIGEDADTLRAFLLIAIQDDDFDSIRDSILESPGKSIEDLLGEIRTKEASLQIKQFGPKGLKSDGTMTSRRSQSSSTGRKGGVAEAIRKGQWVIPTFPHGWKQAIGDKIFKVMCDWRNNAIYKHSLQKTLDENYSLRVDNCLPKKRSNNAFCSSARKTKIQDLDSDGNISMEDTTGKTWDSKAKSSNRGDDGEPKRRRISLSKSRRIVTEKGGQK